LAYSGSEDKKLLVGAAFQRIDVAAERNCFLNNPDQAPIAVNGLFLSI
jgi:hypothetical protein